MFVKSKYVENLLKHNGNFCCTWMHTRKSEILIYIGFSPILLEYVTNLHPSLTRLWLDQNITNIYGLLLPPATKLGQGYIFTGVCDSVNREVCFLPGAGCASSHGSVSSRGMLPPGGDGGASFWGVPPLEGGLVETNPPTAAGGTHPTGMHSCFIDNQKETNISLVCSRKLH